MIRRDVVVHTDHYTAQKKQAVTQTEHNPKMSAKDGKIRKL